MTAQVVSCDSSKSLGGRREAGVEGAGRGGIIGCIDNIRGAWTSRGRSLTHAQVGALLAERTSTCGPAVQAGVEFLLGVSC